MTNIKKIVTYPLALAVLLGGGAVAGYASLSSAQTSTSDASTTSAADVTRTHEGKGFGRGDRGMGMHGKMGRGVHGTVSAVNGNTITVTNTDGTSYTVEATNAQVSKVSTVTVADIQVGDTVGVQGTVSGTNVVATHIMDGAFPKLPQPQHNNWPQG